MQQPGIIIFNGDPGQGDEEYLAWIADNQSGFVANIAREPSSDFIRLHLASCSEAQKHRRPNESLTRHSQWKICSPSQDLLEDYLTPIYGVHRLHYSQCRVRGGCGYFWDEAGHRR